MARYGTVGVLLLAGWSGLRIDFAWVYLAVVVAFEAWLLVKLAAVGSEPAAIGEPPYHFSEEEAKLVGRYRFYFADLPKARQFSSILAAIGLTALLLTPWLAYRQAFIAAALIGVNVLAVAYLTRRLMPMTDTRPAWDKISRGNAAPI